jgi:hypothetical protein
MSWVITPQLKSVDGVPVGTPYGGGYVAGFISHTANGNPTHALIVAPRATGATGSGYTLSTTYQWKTSAASTAGVSSVFDGKANTTAIVTAGIASHPAAEFCVNLSIEGFTDWYLPSRLELEIGYFNLKPTTGLNYTTPITSVRFTGSNLYSVPARNTLYTANNPSQTSLATFNTSAESFTAVLHWSSTPSQETSGFSYHVNFADGRQQAGGNANTNTSFHSVRAFRRIAL